MCEILLSTLGQTASEINRFFPSLHKNNARNFISRSRKQLFFSLRTGCGGTRQRGSSDAVDPERRNKEVEFFARERVKLTFLALNTAVGQLDDDVVVVLVVTAPEIERLAFAVHIFNTHMKGC